MTIAPSTSPTRVKRRFTPSNFSKPRAMVASSIPSSMPTAMAASALSTLCRPGIGSPIPSIVRRDPSRCSATASKREPPAATSTFSARPRPRELGGARVNEPEEAIRDDPPVADAADQALHLGMVDAHDGEAVERHILNELDEGVLGPVERAVMLEMLGIDVGDDRD